MKLVFVSHPFQGDPANVTKIASICRYILANHKGYIPVSPVHCFSWLNDHEPEEREDGLNGALALLRMCDEVWVFGDWENSEGCKKEIALAEELRKPIRTVLLIAPR